jgi:hypothetical protein
MILLLSVLVPVLLLFLAAEPSIAQVGIVGFDSGKKVSSPGQSFGQLRKRNFVQSSPLQQEIQGDVASSELKQRQVSQTQSLRDGTNAVIYIERDISTYHFLPVPAILRYLKTKESKGSDEALVEYADNVGTATKFQLKGSKLGFELRLQSQPDVYLALTKNSQNCGEHYLVAVRNPQANPSKYMFKEFLLDSNNNLKVNLLDPAGSIAELLKPYENPFPESAYWAASANLPIFYFKSKLQTKIFGLTCTFDTSNR